MRVLLVALVLIACTGAFAAGPVAAAPLALTTPQVGTPAPQENPGAYDPYLGLGDLVTKAVPVCCCSSGFCEGTPGAPCADGLNCHCSAGGGACIHR
jgi:hypothetical protein